MSSRAGAVFPPRRRLDSTQHAERCSPDSTQTRCRPGTGSRAWRNFSRPTPTLSVRRGRVSSRHCPAPSTTGRRRVHARLLHRVRADARFSATLRLELRHSPRLLGVGSRARASFRLGGARRSRSELRSRSRRSRRRRPGTHRARFGPSFRASLRLRAANRASPSHGETASQPSSTRREIARQAGEGKPATYS